MEKPMEQRVKRVAQATVGAILILLLAACSGTADILPSASAPAATATPAPISAPAVQVGDAAPAAAPASATSASAADTAKQAIKQVIQQSNQEQQQAVAAHDPTLMRDTATAAYYSQAAQGVDDLLSAGVREIQLVNLEWGPITLQGTTAAQATTTETWHTTFEDGST